MLEVVGPIPVWACALSVIPQHRLHKQPLERPQWNDGKEDKISRAYLRQALGGRAAGLHLLSREEVPEEKNQTPHQGLPAQEEQKEGDSSPDTGGCAKEAQTLDSSSFTHFIIFSTVSNSTTHGFHVILISLALYQTQQVMAFM